MRCILHDHNSKQTVLFVSIIYTCAHCWRHALCIWKSNFELLLQNPNIFIQLNLNMYFYPLNTSEEAFPLQENTSFWCLFLYAHPKWSAFKVYVFSNICFLNFKEFWTFLWRLIVCETTGSYLAFSLLLLLWKHI